MGGRDSFGGVLGSNDQIPARLCRNQKKFLTQRRKGAENSKGSAH
jgi:hypothetical protein